MKYKIEIWQYHSVVETYESDDIEDVLQWYRCYWRWPYELGDCSFDVYKDGRILSWNEEYKLGFCD
jgi:hypothetical protein